jgi:hypothetical protein
MSSQFSERINAVYNKYKEYTNQRNQNRIEIATIFFNQFILPNVESTLIRHAGTGKKWGYVYTFPKNCYIMRDTDALELVNISNGWRKGSFHIVEIIKETIFIQLKTSLEQHMSDDTTGVRIHFADEIDNEGLYSGFWAEWYSISPFSELCQYPFSPTN